MCRNRRKGSIDMNRAETFNDALAQVADAERKREQADHPGARKIRREDVEDFGMPRVLEWQRTLADAKKRLQQAADELVKCADIADVAFDAKGAPLLTQGDLIWGKEARSVYRFKEDDPNSYVATTSLPDILSASLASP